jgi:hypothetical protein
MMRCPIRTRGRVAGPGDAQETTTPVAGFSPQVRWICSGVPSAAPVPARARRVRAAAFAGLAVAASRPVPPAPASTWRRDMDEREDRELPEFSGTTET